MRKLIVCLVLACGLVSLPSRAEPKVESLMDCLSPCSIYDTQCVEQCATKAEACRDCCHMKMPSASKAHCLTACRNNLNSYKCTK